MLPRPPMSTTFPYTTLFRDADVSSGFFRDDAGDAEQRKQGALQAEFAAAGVIPFLQGVRTAAVAARSKSDSIDAERKGHIGVRGSAFGAGFIADKGVRVAQGREQRRIAAEFAAGTAAEQIHFPIEFALGTIARGFQFIADAGSDGVAQRGFEAREFLFALG